MSELVDKLRGYVSVLPKAKRNRTDLVRWMIRRPLVLAGIGAYETGLLLSTGISNRHKGLAQIRTSSLIGCVF